VSASSDPADRLARDILRAARRPGARKTILLDVDGTLAPIAAVPELARVPRATLAALERLVVAGWRVAIVSGRPLDELLLMVPVAGVQTYGSHGFEGPSPKSRSAIARQVVRRLSVLARAARRLARRTPGARVESKPAGIALHDRLVANGELAVWHESVRALLDAADLAGLEIVRGRRVIEVRVRGPQKGDVAHRLTPLRTSRRLDASLIAIGDDTTDEDMFRAIKGRGVSIRVGRRGVRTLATRRLASPAAVGHLLERLADDAASIRRTKPVSRRKRAARSKPGRSS
jgi:trehalose-phosphatase